MEPALAIDLKLTDAVTPFWLAGREFPRPLLEATRDERAAELDPIGQLDDVPVYSHPENIYADVETDSGREACHAQGLGGDLTVKCNSDGGDLVVRENAWDGWSATVNGIPERLVQNRWLTVRVPQGPVEVRFRYLPADALVGVLLSLGGVTAVVFLWFRERRRIAQEGSAHP